MTSSCATPDQITNRYESKIYQNNGNQRLLDLLSRKSLNILDIGCGAGDNAKLILSTITEANIYGITLSLAEANIAQQYMKKCWIADIEHDLPVDILAMQFDALIFSHVLEHLRNPAEVLARYVALLHEEGEVLIAVPNLLSWKFRLQFLIGRFEYESGGVLDDTHLRFFTFDSADHNLLCLTPELHVVNKTAEGSVPLWILRRYILPKSISEWLDRLGCKHFPNLFGNQVLIKALKRKASL